MTSKSKKKDSVVKIDTEVLKKIDEFIKREENRLNFVNKKHFVDVVVSEYLKKQETKK